MHRPVGRREGRVGKAGGREWGADDGAVLDQRVRIVGKSQVRSSRRDGCCRTGRHPHVQVRSSTSTFEIRVSDERARSGQICRSTPRWTERCRLLRRRGPTAIGQNLPVLCRRRSSTLALMPTRTRPVGPFPPPTWNNRGIGQTCDCHRGRPVVMVHHATL
jgi:hypothetical protein